MTNNAWSWSSSSSPSSLLSSSLRAAAAAAAPSLFWCSNLGQEASKVCPHARENFLFLGLIVSLFLGFFLFLPVTLLLSGKRKLAWRHSSNEGLNRQVKYSPSTVKYCDVTKATGWNIWIFLCQCGWLFYRDSVLPVLLLLCSNPLDLSSLCAPALLKDEWSWWIQRLNWQFLSQLTKRHLYNYQTSFDLWASDLAFLLCTFVGFSLRKWTIWCLCLTCNNVAA